MRRVAWKVAVILCSLLLIVAGIWAASHFLSEDEDRTVGYPVTVNGITLERRPLSICSFSPGLTGTLVTLGVSDQIACITDYCDKTKLEKAKTIGSLYAPDFGVLSQVQPELAIALGDPSEATLQRLKILDIPLLVLPPAKDLEGIKTNAEDLLVALYGSEKGKEKYAAYEMDLNFQLEKCKELTKEQKIGVLWLTADGNSAATNDTLGGKLLAEAGFENAATGENYAWDESLLPTGDLRLILIDENSWNGLDADRKALLEDSCDRVIFFENQLLERQSEGLAGIYAKLSLELEKLGLQTA